jgi:hypothetical protein
MKQPTASKHDRERMRSEQARTKPADDRHGPQGRKERRQGLPAAGEKRPLNQQQQEQEQEPDPGQE